MKVTVDIDCTPLEARQFFGLPDVQPMQAAVLAEMERRTLAEMEKFTPENLLQTWFSTGQQGADMFAKDDDPPACCDELREVLMGYPAHRTAAPDLPQIHPCRPGPRPDRRGRDRALALGAHRSGHRRGD